MATLHSSNLNVHAVPPNHLTAPVLEFRCLFTPDLRKKQKKWQDGRLKYHTFNKKVMVYDERSNLIGDAHWREDYRLEEGSELQLERGNCLVEVSEFIDKRDQDLSELVEKPIKDKENRARIRASVAPSPIRPQQTPNAQHFRPKPLTAVLGTPSGHYGRAMVSIESPYEQKHRAALQPQESPRPAKRQRHASPPPSNGYAQKLTGATLSLSSRTPASLINKHKLQSHPNARIPVCVANIDLTSDDDDQTHNQPKRAAITYVPHVPPQRTKRTAKSPPPASSYARNLTGGALCLTSNTQPVKQSFGKAPVLSKKLAVGNQQNVKADTIDALVSPTPPCPSPLWIDDDEAVVPVERRPEKATSTRKGRIAEPRIASDTRGKTADSQKNITPGTNKRSSAPDALDLVERASATTQPSMKKNNPISKLQQPSREKATGCVQLKHPPSASTSSAKSHIGTTNSVICTTPTETVKSHDNSTVAPQPEMHQLRIRSKPKRTLLRSTSATSFISNVADPTKRVAESSVRPSTAAEVTEPTLQIRKTAKKTKMRSLSSDTITDPAARSLAKKKPSMEPPEASQATLRLQALGRAQEERLQKRKKMRVRNAPKAVPAPIPSYQENVDQPTTAIAEDSRAVLTENLHEPTRHTSPESFLDEDVMMDDMLFVEDINNNASQDVAHQVNCDDDHDQGIRTPDSSPSFPLLGHPATSRFDIVPISNNSVQPANKSLLNTQQRTIDAATMRTQEAGPKVQHSVSVIERSRGEQAAAIPSSMPASKLALEAESYQEAEANIPMTVISTALPLPPSVVQSLEPSVPSIPPPGTKESVVKATLSEADAPVIEESVLMPFDLKPVPKSRSSIAKKSSSEGRDIDIATSVTKPLPSNTPLVSSSIEPAATLDPKRSFEWPVATATSQVIVAPTMKAWASSLSQIKADPPPRITSVRINSHLDILNKPREPDDSVPLLHGPRPHFPPFVVPKAVPMTNKQAASVPQMTPVSDDHHDSPAGDSHSVKVSGSMDPPPTTMLARLPHFVRPTINMATHDPVAAAAATVHAVENRGDESIVDKGRDIREVVYDEFGPWSIEASDLFAWRKS